MVTVKKIIKDGFVDERRYLWMTRAFTIMAVASICCNLALFYVIINMATFNPVEPFLVDMNNKVDQEIYVEPIDQYFRSNINYRRDAGTRIAQRLALQYVVARESFPENIEKRIENWGVQSYLRSMTHEGIYKSFINSDFFNQAKSTSGGERKSRSVVIDEITMLENRKTFEISGFVRDTYTSVARTPEVDRFKVEIQFDFSSDTALDSNLKRKNPLGFVVRRYDRTPPVRYDLK